MAPEARRSPLLRVFAFVGLLVSLAAPAHALRVIDWNILNYPGSTGSTRDPKYRDILLPLHPDLIIVEEMTSQTGVNEFLNSVLNTMEPGQWAAAEFVDGNDTDAAMFYKPAQFNYLRQFTFYPNAANHLRLVHDFIVRPAGYTTDASNIRFYAVHLKASTGSTNVAQRDAEAQGMRDSMNAVQDPNPHMFSCGDFNLYTGTEPALGDMINPGASSVGRCYDPLGLQGITWQDNSSIAIHHTQSPCKGPQPDPNCASGASTGGLDDRFDLFLPTLNWNDGQGFELIPNSYISVGNDGQHLNLQLIDPPTIPEGSTYAAELQGVSDHLPQRIDIQVQSLGSVASSLDLGTVIASGSGTLPVGNVATPPADGLTFTLTPPAGFQLPVSAFDVPAGNSTNVTVETAAAPPFGPRAGNLGMDSDDPNAPHRDIALTANVLDHAHASLDSESVVTSAPLDFGSEPQGGFSPMLVAVHNTGYSSAQARLSLNGATIDGGDGRFSIPGGFSPTLIADVGQRYDVVFDDTGATQDSTYTATLTFTSADESLPGGGPQPDLTVSLTAHTVSGSTGIPTVNAPLQTMLYAPTPNPLHGTSRVRLDLSRGSDVRLEVIDLAGRRVSTLSHGMLDAGRYTFEWAGRDDQGGAVSAGVYFVRLAGSGLRTQATRLAVVR